MAIRDFITISEYYIPEMETMVLCFCVCVSVVFFWGGGVQNYVMKVM